MAHDPLLNIFDTESYSLLSIVSSTIGTYSLLQTQNIYFSGTPHIKGNRAL